MKIALKLVGAFICAIAVMACNQSSNSISGTITGGEGKTIFLDRMVDGKLVSTDSATIDQNGKFNIYPNPSLEKNFYWLKLDRDHYTIVITDSTECLNIETTVEDLGYKGSISGSHNSLLLQSYYENMRSLSDKYNGIIEQLKAGGIPVDQQAQLKQDAQKVADEMLNYSKDFIDSNLPSPAAFAALPQLKIQENRQYYSSVLEKTKDEFGHTQQYKMVSEQYANSNKQQAAQPKKAEKNSKYSAGMTPPDISMPDPNGKTRSLSDLKGKVVLIDFWASWCGPCRRENPNVIRAYNKYHNDGFEIFSVSLDKDKARWLAAIEKDQLIWDNHVSDLAGWNNAAAKKYGVHSIPHTILLDKNGEIIDTHLRGPALDAALETIFGH